MTDLLDTCILIDVLRGRTKAVEWLETQGEVPAISVITLMELRAGVRGKKEEEQLEKLFAVLTILDVSKEIAEMAGAYLARFARSHGVDVSDALIAATCEVHNCRLATLNLKHFPMIDGLKRPYTA